MITDRLISGQFNARLAPTYRTLLIGGAREPLYVPGRGRAPAMIRYTQDYPRSALHELAHWALAGSRRRRLVDYGYWYVPPPRSVEDQIAFFDAELRVQALESLFCHACDLDFQVSVDNLEADPGDFAARVADTAESLLRNGVKGRAEQILRALGEVQVTHG